MNPAAVLLQRHVPVIIVKLAVLCSGEYLRLHIISVLLFSREPSTVNVLLSTVSLYEVDSFVKLRKRRKGWMVSAAGVME